MIREGVEKDFRLNKGPWEDLVIWNHAKPRTKESSIFRGRDTQRSKRVRVSLSSVRDHNRVPKTFPESPKKNEESKKYDEMVGLPRHLLLSKKWVKQSKINFLEINLGLDEEPYVP